MQLSTRSSGMPDGSVFTMESTRRLRELTQHTRDDEYYASDWLDRNLLRRVSVHLTRFFLWTGLSPNKVTLLSLAPGIAAGGLLIMPQPQYWLMAWGLLLVYGILDCCDGEIARYRRSSSLVGEYNDGIAGVLFLRPFIRTCMCFGVYRALGDPLVLAFGFALIIGWVVYALSPFLCVTILSRRSVPLERDHIEDPGQVTPTLSRGILPQARAFFGHTGFFFTLPVISILDMFISPFHLGSFELNFRFLYLAISAVAIVLASVTRVYDINKYGLRVCR